MRHLCVLLVALACSGPRTPVRMPRHASRPESSLAPQHIAYSPRRYEGDVDGFCTVTRARRVVCWGLLWDATATPHPIEGIDDAVEVVPAPGFACARRASGQVDCFDRGRRIATSVEDAIDLEAVDDELCAVRATGEVACFGGPWNAPPWRASNERTAWASPEWLRVSVREGIDDAQAIYGSREGPAWCALRRSGRVTCWGWSHLPGEVTPGAVDHPEGPVENYELRDLEASDLVLGAGVSCVLRRAGGVLCAGEGLEPPADAAPEGWTPIEASTDVTSLLPARATPPGMLACGRVADAIRCWPASRDGEEEAIAPPWHDDRRMLVDAFLGARQRDLGEQRFGCMRFAEGDVSCWGEADLLGRDLNVPSPPRAIEALSRVERMITGDTSTCALSVGALRCWGGNLHGELAEREDDALAMPEPSLLSGVERGDRVFMGAGSICAIDGRGRVRCRGQLAGELRAAAHPGPAGAQPVRDPSWLALGSLANVRDLAISERTVCAVAGRGLSCAGRDLMSGAPAPPTNARFRAIPSIRDATRVALANDFGCVRHQDGRVSCFGRGVPARAGNDPRPMPEEGIRGVTQLAVGNGYACVLSNGQARCWGVRTAPALSAFGDATPAENGRLLVDVPGATDAVALAAGEDHACLVRATGSVLCWGANDNGELGVPRGQGAFSDVADVQDARDVIAGSDHSCALLREGGVRCWGSDTNEQIGDGPRSVRSETPVAVEHTE